MANEPIAESAIVGEWKPGPPPNKETGIGYGLLVWARRGKHGPHYAVINDARLVLVVGSEYRRVEFHEIVAYAYFNPPPHLVKLAGERMAAKLAEAKKGGVDELSGARMREAHRRRREFA